MKKNRILGIAALVAAVVLGLVFTACPPVEDNEERVVTFINQSEAAIQITCIGSNPSSFTLAKATSSADQNPPTKEVRRTGKDIELTSIAVTSPNLGPEPWNYLDISGAAAAGKGKGNGIFLKAGTLIFKAAQGVSGNPLTYKIDAIPLDE